MTARQLLGALRLLRERTWIVSLLIVVVLSVLFVQLGEWQHHRYLAKVARNAVIDANYDAAPVPLASVLATPDAVLAPSDQWRPVTVTGEYVEGRQELVRNRPLEGNGGFEVLVPLRQADGTLVLVDRGWVGLADDSVSPAPVPAPPSGTVTVTMRLRPGEAATTHTPPPGQEQRIDLDRIAGFQSGPLYRAYGVMAAEQPAAAAVPTALPKPDEDLGPHLGYAWQWWMFALAGYGVLGYYLLREARLRDGATGPVLRVPGRSRRPRRISDEEWEDAHT